MRKILYISLLVLSALACGAPSMLFPVPRAAPVPRLETGVPMVVSVDEGLNVRTGAGETYPFVQGKHVLFDGDLVNCFEFRVVGDGLWCRHEKGWSNARWLNGIIEGNKE